MLLDVSLTLICCQLFLVLVYLLGCHVLGCPIDLTRGGVFLNGLWVWMLPSLFRVVTLWFVVLWVGVLS